jgi:hypothetical protein
MLLVGFEPMIAACELLYTYALDCVATGTGLFNINIKMFYHVRFVIYVSIGVLKV